jgi:hypothetical protein
MDRRTDARGRHLTFQAVVKVFDVVWAGGYVLSPLCDVFIIDEVRDLWWRLVLAQPGAEGLADP